MTYLINYTKKEFGNTIFGIPIDALTKKGAVEIFWQIMPKCCVKIVEIKKI